MGRSVDAAAASLLLLAMCGCAAARRPGERMEPTNLSGPSAEMVQSMSDGEFADLLTVGVESATRRPVTHRFGEMGHEAPEPIVSLMREPWEARVPDGATPFGPGGGQRVDALRQLWCGWNVPGAIVALSIHAEAPLEARLEPDDRRVPGALVAPDRAMLRYVWRRDGDRFRLRRISFRAFRDEAPRVDDEEPGSASPDPTLTVTCPVPAAAERHVLVAWVEPRGKEMAVRFARDRGRDAVGIATVPLGPWRPLPRQRPGLWTDREGRPVLRLIAEHDVTRGYAVITAAPGSTADSLQPRVAPFATAPGTLVSAASVFFRNAYEPLALSLALDRDGALRMIGTGEPAVVRRSVPEGYDFPIAASVSRAYEAYVAEGGDVLLRAFP
jgi:hypothetical protein